ncbi:hypothetical protein DAI22_01g007300 [Oryza sativa Japonica Group]|nr:hypothetical protein DAI22_01g007300 [Oryza sativa Japonica Group]
MMCGEMRQERQIAQGEATRLWFIIIWLFPIVSSVPFFDAVIFRRRRHSHPSGDEISHHLKLAQSPVPAGQPVSCATTGSLSVSAFFRCSLLHATERFI